MRRANNNGYLEIIENIARKYKELNKLKRRPKEFNRLALSILREIKRLIDALVLARRRKNV